MDQQDKSFMTVLTVVIGALVVLTAVVFVAARMVANVSDDQPEDAARIQTAIEDRIKPVGNVAVLDPNAPAEAAATEAPAPAPTAAAAQSPEQIVTQVCAACHQAGVLNAPKIGAKEDWEPRMAQGLDTLVSHAVNGFNAMPANGGNPNLTEDDIRASTLWMLAESGIDMGGDAPSTEPDSAQQEPAAAEPAAAEQEPAKAEPEPAVSTESDTGGADLAKGEEVYKTACFACHDTGAANAPKLGDKDAWASRIAKGMDTLVGHAINGLNAMPPKGGAMHLSDEDIGSSVAYMVNGSQ